MGLVEDDHVVLGQHDAAAGQVRPVEVGVDDDDVGHRGPLAGGLGEAAPAGRAVVGTRALPRAHAHHVPGPVGGLEAQVGPVAGLRLLRPGHQLAHFLHDALGRRTRRRLRRLALLGRGRRRLVGPAGPLVTQLGLNATRAHLGHPLAADVVAPSLEHGEVERRRQPEAGVHLGEVLLGQLVLQRLGRRGDDDFLAAQRGGDEIGQGLSCPRAGLDDEVGPRDDRLGHGPAHLLLLGTVLAAGHLRRDLVQPRARRRRRPGGPPLRTRPRSRRHRGRRGRRALRRLSEGVVEVLACHQT